MKANEKEMKAIINITSILAPLIMIVSCATTPRVLPEKYNFDNYLKEVNRISTPRVSGLENIDNQAVILRASLRAGGDDYYLLVLRQPIEKTHSHVNIAIENTAAKDKAYSTENILSEMRDSSSHGLPETDFHQAPSNIVNIRAGFDRIAVAENAMIEYYVIEKIYRLNGKEQAEEIKKWLRKDKDAEVQILRTHRFETNSP